MSERLDDYDTSMIDHIGITVTCGDTVWDGWHSLQGVAMLGITIPEVLYRIDLGDPARTATERRTLATVLASVAAEPMLTVIRSVNAEEFYQASQGASEQAPARCTLTLSSDGHTLYQRVFLVWPDDTADVHGICAALPVMGNGGVAFEEFQRMVFPEFDYNSDLFAGLTEKSRQEVLIAIVAYKLMEKLINGNPEWVEDKGYALPDDENLGFAQPAWQGALDSLPMITLSDVAGEFDFDEIERYANQGDLSDGN